MPQFDNSFLVELQIFLEYPGKKGAPIGFVEFTEHSYQTEDDGKSYVERTWRSRDGLIGVDSGKWDWKNFNVDGTENLVGIDFNGLLSGAIFNGKWKTISPPWPWFQLTDNINGNFYKNGQRTYFYCK